MKRLLVHTTTLKSILFLLCINMVFSVSADPKYLIPPGYIIGYWAVVALIVFLSSVFLSWLIRITLNTFTEAKRKKSWLLSLVLFVFLGSYIWAEKFNGLLFGSLESEKGAAFYYGVYWTGLSLSIVLGGILGYFISPKQ